MAIVLKKLIDFFYESKTKTIVLSVYNGYFVIPAFYCLLYFPFC